MSRRGSLHTYAAFILHAGVSLYPATAAWLPREHSTARMSFPYDLTVEFPKPPRHQLQKETV